MGYGQLRVDGKPQYVHRLVYEALRGEIPKGLHLDHLCRTPACVNPWHLEPVTQQENVRRGARRVLAEEDIIHARNQVAEGNWTVLDASEYLKVDKSYTSKIIRGLYWEDIGGPFTNVGQSAGDKHWCAKYSEDMVRKVKQLRGNISANEAASRFGVETHVIRRLWRKSSWSHLENAAC